MTLIHPYTNHSTLQDNTQQDTAQPTTTITPQDSTQANTTPPPATPDFPHTHHNIQHSAPGPRPTANLHMYAGSKQLYLTSTSSQPLSITPTYHHHHNSVIPLRFTVRTSLFEDTPHSHLPDHLQHSHTTFSQHPTHPPFSISHHKPTYGLITPEASSGPEGPWWDAAGSAP